MYLNAVFEQSRSPKGVAVAKVNFDPLLYDDDWYRVALTRLVTRNIRQLAIQAHGADPMPPDDGTYRLEPWPPERDLIDPHLCHTKLLYGDGITNLRTQAAERLREAERNGATIRVPIRPPLETARDVREYVRTAPPWPPWIRRELQFTSDDVPLFRRIRDGEG